MMRLFRPGRIHQALPNGTFRFATFEANANTGELRQNGSRVPIPEQSFQVLQALLERSGEMVTRRELQSRLWPGDRFGDLEHGLNRVVNRLREALGDDPEHPTYIETLPRRGYRFIAPVVSSLPESRGVRGWGMTASIASLLAAAVGGLILSSNSGMAPSVLGIAVLPFEYAAGNADEEYLANGVTDALIGQLAQVRAFRRVLSRRSVMPLKHRALSTGEFVREFQVDAVVRGSVERLENRIRISVNLFRRGSERPVWRATYDRDEREILAVESEIAREVAAQTQAVLSADERHRMALSRSVEPQVWRAYAKGRMECDRWTEAGVRTGVASFEEAISRDPEFGEAYSALAACQEYLVTFGLEPPGSGFAKARTSALRALTLNPSLAEAQAILGMMRLQYEWDWRAADESTQRAIELAPSSDFTHSVRSVYLTAVGQFDDGIAEARRGEELAPGSVTAASFVAWSAAKARRYVDAAREWRRILRGDPEHAWLWAELAFALHRMGKVGEARTACAEARRRMPSGVDQIDDFWLAEVEVAAGREKDVLESIHGWERRRAQQYVDPYNIAAMYSLAGRRDEAVEWLETAYRERSPSLYALKVDPTLDALRTDTRFAALLRRMQFPD